MDFSTNKVILKASWTREGVRISSLWYYQQGEQFKSQQEILLREVWTYGGLNCCLLLEVALASKQYGLKQSRHNGSYVTYAVLGFLHSSPGEHCESLYRCCTLQLQSSAYVDIRLARANTWIKAWDRRIAREKSDKTASAPASVSMWTTVSRESHLLLPCCLEVVGDGQRPPGPGLLGLRKSESGLGRNRTAARWHCGSVGARPGCWQPPLNFTNPCQPPAAIGNHEQCLACGHSFQGIHMSRSASRHIVWLSGVEEGG